MLSGDNLSKLFLRYHDDMLRLACFYLKNPRDAEDVVGDCWVSVILHKEKLAALSEAHARSYLLRCAANASIDLLRKRRREAARLEHARRDTEASGDISPEETAIQRLMIDEVYRMLPRRESEIFVLWMQGLPFSAIARRLGISSSTARRYWWRVKQKLYRLAREA